MNNLIVVLSIIVIVIVSACSSSVSQEKVPDKQQSLLNNSLVLKKGSVTISDDKGAKSLQGKGKQIGFSDGDIIKTGKSSRVLIQLSASEDRIEMYSNTTLLVQKKDGTDIHYRLNLGKARFLVRKNRLQKRHLRIVTSNALIGVKGTEFVVDCEKGETSLLTLHGIVSLANSKSPEKAVDVTTNQVSRVQTNRIPTKPVMISADNIRKILSSDDPKSFNKVNFGPPMPKTPQLSSKAGDAMVELNWQSDNNADYFEIHWCSEIDKCNKTYIIKVIDNQYLHKRLQNGVLHRYRILAGNTSGTSSLSNEVDALPQISAPVAPLIKIQPGTRSIALSWDKVATASKYEIYWATNLEDLNTTNNKIVVETNYLIHEDLENNVPYYYRVKAINNGGSSSFSNVENAIPRIWLKLIRSIKELLQSETDN
ncbi:FecR domain-containing protein [bacterium]|nr:FecR domain-containing protein [bacterium]